MKYFMTVLIIQGFSLFSIYSYCTNSHQKAFKKPIKFQMQSVYSYYLFTVLGIIIIKHKLKSYQKKPTDYTEFSFSHNSPPSALCCSVDWLLSNRKKHSAEPGSGWAANVSVDPCPTDKHQSVLSISCSLLSSLLNITPRYLSSSI